MDNDFKQQIVGIIESCKNQIIIYEQTKVFDKNYFDEDEFFASLAKSVSLGCRYWVCSRKSTGGKVMREDILLIVIAVNATFDVKVK